MLRAMQRFLHAVGAGPKRARALSRDEAREAMGSIASGAASPEQVGGFLMALRMKGESAEELCGFVEALEAQCVDRPRAPTNLCEVDAHGDGHGASLLVAAACASAALGVPVCLGVERGSPFARSGLDGTLAALGVDGALDAQRAARDLARAGLAVRELSACSAALGHLFGLRRLLGVRTVAQTLAKLFSPFAESRCRVAGVFHAPYLEPTAQALALLGVERGAAVQALGGLPEARPGKVVRLADGRGARTVDLRPLAMTGAGVVGDAATSGALASADEASALDGGPATWSALRGEEPYARRAAATAGLLLHVATGAEPLAAAGAALAALRDGQARAVAERLRC